LKRQYSSSSLQVYFGSRLYDSKIWIQQLSYSVTMALKSSSNKVITATDDELLQQFLYNKIHNKPLPNHITILEYDLFGTAKNPWEIWEEFGTTNSYRARDLYFFTTLKKKSATSSRIVRTIGLGRWEGEDAGKNVFSKDKNQLLGMKKRFRFEKSGTSQDGGWILHEFSLQKSLISNPLVSPRF